MPDEDLATPCGIYCGNCQHYEKKCKGCGVEVGLPFWAQYLDVIICPLFKCCVFDKKLEHCGECSELPCDFFIKFRVPSLDSETAEILLKSRQNDLLLRKKIGTKKWLELKEKKQKK